MKRNYRLQKFVLAVTISAVVFTHAHFYFHVFYKPLLCFKNALTERPFDAVIIPGIPYDGHKISSVMQWRVAWSVLLYKKGIAKNIIYSGGTVYTPYTEAVVMALYAQKMGVPKEHIFLETKAEHTTENLYYSWELARKNGFQKIAFATDPFQSIKAEPYLKKFGLNITLVPIVISFLEHAEIKEYEIKSSEAYDLNFISILKRETPDEREFYSGGGRIPLKKQ